MELIYEVVALLGFCCLDARRYFSLGNYFFSRNSQCTLKWLSTMLNMRANMEVYEAILTKRKEQGITGFYIKRI